MTLQSGAPAPVLLAALAGAGWGDLAGPEWRGVRAVLTTLVDTLPARSGQGMTTAEQLAERAGYSPRWTRRCLHALEDLGLIDWHRGGVHAGKPQPSFIRVEKSVLLALVQLARRSRDAALAALRERTAARLAGLRLLYVKSKKRQNRRSAHAELNYSPTPVGEGTGASSPPVPPSRAGQPADPEHVKASLAAARAAIAAARRGRK